MTEAKIIDPVRSEAGRVLGSFSCKAKGKRSRQNGKLGGRPRIYPHCTIWNYHKWQRDHRQECRCGLRRDGTWNPKRKKGLTRQQKQEQRELYERRRVLRLWKEALSPSELS